jgi:hypothetical protein
VRIADGLAMSPGKADFELQPMCRNSPAEVVREARRLLGLAEWAKGG